MGCEPHPQPKEQEPYLWIIHQFHITPVIHMEAIGYKVHKREQVMVLIVEWVMAVQDQEIIQQKEKTQDEQGEPHVAIDVPDGFLRVYVGLVPRCLWGVWGVVMGVPPGGTPNVPYLCAILVDHLCPPQLRNHPLT